MSLLDYDIQDIIATDIKLSVVISGGGAGWFTHRLTSNGGASKILDNIYIPYNKHTLYTFINEKIDENNTAKCV